MRRVSDRKLRASVVIPTYNRAAILAHTLRSLTRQSVARDDFEVIVADDGSSDDTRAVVQRFSSLLQLHYCYQPDEGFRVAAARNLGLSVASGRVAIFLDSGVVATPALLEHHLRAHERAAARLATVGYVFGFNQDDAHGDELASLIDLERPEASIERLAAQPRHLDIRDRAYKRYNDDLSNLPAPWSLFWTCNAAVSTDAARELGGFDENFKSWGVEDVEFAYRLHRAGMRFELVREGAGIHYPHAKDYEANMRSLDANCDYFHVKFPSRETALFRTVNALDINDVLLSTAQQPTA